MRTLNFIIIVTLTLMASACKTQQAYTNDNSGEVFYENNSVSFITNGSLSMLMDKAQSENKIIFLDFYADWCGPCKTMDHEVFSDEKIGEFFNENFINFKVNGETGNGREIANLYEVKGYPTVIFIDPKGVVLNRQIGLIFEKQLMSLAERSIDLHKMNEL